MSKKRIAVLRTGRAAEWRSCQFIVDNLEAAYRELSSVHDVQLLHYDPSAALPVRLLQLERLLNFDPDRIALIDEGGFAPRVTSQLSPSLRKVRQRAYSIHCFGDFSVLAREWKAAERALLGESIAFYAASDRASQMVGQFLRSPEAVRTLPFPVNEKIFGPQLEERRRFRAQLSVRPDDFILLYSGRISLQKNLTLLWRELHAAALKSPRRILFLTAGVFDAFGAPFLNRYETPGVYLQEWRAVLEKFPPHPKLAVRYLGPLSPEELSRAYNGADALVSLSMHHDEDFGMAVAESLACGCPAILSDWGGYANFKLPNVDAVATIPLIRDSEGNPEFDANALEETLLTRIREPRNDAQRLQISSSCLARFSAPSVADRLQADLEAPIPPFLGFTKRYLAGASLRRPEDQFGKSGFANPEYWAQYRPYFEDVGANCSPTS